VAASASPPGNPLEDPLPLSTNGALDEALPPWEELLLDPSDPAELDALTELALEEAVTGVDDEEPEPTGGLVLAEEPWGVVDPEVAAVFDPPDEHPGSAVSSHTPVSASGLRRLIDERK
jgi:hypothetical protein